VGLQVRYQFLQLAAAIRGHRTEELLALLRQSGLVVAPVNPVSAVREMPGVREHLTRTNLPDGRQVRLPPAAVDTGRQEFPLAPHYGEHTRKILEQTGLEDSAIDDLVREGVVR